jgi:hypothetical protein
MNFMPIIMHEFAGALTQYQELVSCFPLFKHLQQSCSTGNRQPVRMSYSQLPEFAVLSVPELAEICASLEQLTDPMALGHIGVRVDRLLQSIRTLALSEAPRSGRRTVHGATSVRRIPWADATASRLDAGVGRRTSDLELRLAIAPANRKRLSISSAHTDYTESAPPPVLLSSVAHGRYASSSPPI